jgi:hypothetical protein
MPVAAQHAASLRAVLDRRQCRDAEAAGDELETEGTVLIRQPVRGDDAHGMAESDTLSAAGHERQLANLAPRES